MKIKLAAVVSACIFHASVGFCSPNPATQDWVRTYVQSWATSYFQSQPTVGQSAYGGVIYYVYMDSTGTHGLIAATADEPGGANYNWDSSSTPGSAQYACATKTVTVGGSTYHDWIVPSQAQMTALYNNRYAINPSDPNGGFSDQTTGPQGANYWTSTASETPGFAWTQVFSNGGMQDKVTAELRLVRCIRTF